MLPSLTAGAQSFAGHRRSRARLTLACAVVVLAGCHKRSVRYSAPPAPLPDATAEAATAEARPAPRVRRPAPVLRPEPDAERAGGAGAGLGAPVSTEVGLASWYGPPYHNHQAADGSVFDQNALTAAHRELPMGTMVRVTNLATGEQIVVKITDRGPFVPGRTLDLSLAAAKAIDVYRAGVAKVRVEAFAKPGADPEGRWCVQIGVFLTAEDAVQLKNDLTRRYAASAKVIEFAGPTGYWVRINPVQADKGNASRIAETIHIPDAESYLVRLN